MGIRRRNEEEYAPTPLSVVLGAVFGLTIGVLLAGANLAVIAPQVVSELPTDEDRKPGAVYFVRPSDAGGANWRGPRDQLVTGSGTVSVSEGELNTWVRSQFRPAPPVANPDASFLQFEVLADPPGFRLLEDELEISANLRVNAFGSSQTILYQARGGFALRGGRWEFEPTQAFLGSCPIPSTGGLARRIQAALAGQFLGNEEYVAVSNAWERLRSVQVANQRLELAR